MPTKPSQRALVSTSDKTGLVDFVQQLVDFGIEIIATGGTAKLLKQNDIPVIDVSSYTGFPEIMDGRVKTLHPKIHGGLLARRGIDDETLKAHDINPIDYVIVNLYPFEKTIASPDTTLPEAIEQIDIGGPTMLRSAAKNHEAVTVVVDPTDYPSLIDEIKTQGGTSKSTRARCAQKCFAHTSSYDGIIADYLMQQCMKTNESTETDFSDNFTPTFKKVTDLRYGENPHQEAAFYQTSPITPNSLANATLLQGKPLSYNNLIDSDAALGCVRAFDAATPACVIVKHATPCGVALGTDTLDAYQRAFATDSSSAFGGIVAINQALTAEAAEFMLNNQFIEVLIAPEINIAAKTVLTRKANLRVLITGYDTPNPKEHKLASISGGLLVQQNDALIQDPSTFTVATKREPTKQEWQDLLFAWKVVKFAKSNAIVYAKDAQACGIGTGQTSRVFSAKIAVLKAEEAALSLDHAVMASDAFFPFADGLEVAIEAGIKAVIQPGGSKRDSEVIAAADASGIAMVLTGSRHFKH